MKAILGSTDKRTLVEKARAKLARSNRKHKEALAEFAAQLVDLLPGVIMHASDMGHRDVSWDVLTTDAYKVMVANPYFLRDNKSLSTDDYAFVHETVLNRARAEPGLTWRVFYPSDPNIITLSWL